MPSWAGGEVSMTKRDESEGVQRSYSSEKAARAGSLSLVEV